MNKKFAFFWVRNIAIAFTLISSVFAFAFLLLFLNDYFDTELFSVSLVILSVGFILFMCYKIAQDQYEKYQYQNQRIMDALQKDNNP